jgi:ribonuclease E
MSDDDQPQSRREDKSVGAQGDAESSTAAAGGPDPADDDRNPELPDRIRENRPRSAEAADRALVRKPKIGDSRPAPKSSDDADNGDRGEAEGRGRQQSQRSPGQGGGGRGGRRRRRGGRGGRGGGGQGGPGRGGGRGGGGEPTADNQPNHQPIEATSVGEPVELDEETLEKRRGRQRKGKPVGRYSMFVSVGPKATQIAIEEGRALIEHYVSRPSDDTAQIHGNIYLGRVQNVLPGMEAAFVDIGTPKNAVLYRGDVQYDPEDVESSGRLKIEQILKPSQTIVCQVTKNPIGHKGARLTQEVSLPGRFVVLVPNSPTVGISKRLRDKERKRLRRILDEVRLDGHGLIVRTAAENVTAEEIRRDVERLAEQWRQIDQLAQQSAAPALLYREPDMALRVIREEFNKDYRSVVIDDPGLFDEVKGYLSVVTPALAGRVQLVDEGPGGLPLFERYHVHEQLHKALDRKVWLPSGGSLIIEHTEALTVIDVNTGKNVGKSSLEETVYRNNLEAAEEVARQLRLRDIGGIIVIDFIDMEIKKNRAAVIKKFREALARDKTRTQVFDISDLGLVEMTRKRIGEGLLESFTDRCEICEGRGVVLQPGMLDN